MAKLFAKNAYPLLHHYDRDGKFDKAVAHGIVAEITARIAGNQAGSGFAAGFTNEMLVNKIKEWSKNDPAKAQWISASLGAMINTVNKNEKMQVGAAVSQYGIKWNSYETRPWYNSAFIEDVNGKIWVRKNDTDEPYYQPVPKGAYIWKQDVNNPIYGWDYQVGAGENGDDKYIDENVTTSFYVEHNGTAYGVTILNYTQEQRQARIRELSKEYLEAVMFSKVTPQNFELIKNSYKLINENNDENVLNFIKVVLCQDFGQIKLRFFAS